MILRPRPSASQSSTVAIRHRCQRRRSSVANLGSPRSVRTAPTAVDASLPPTISVEEAALLLGVSRSAAYRAAKAGQLQTFRMGRKLLVPTAPLLRMLGR